MSLFATPYQASPSTKTAAYSVSVSDDLVPFLITAAATATLPLTGSAGFGGQTLASRQGGQGVVYIQNSATSTANVTIAATSGDVLFGSSVVAPGQIVACISNGSGTWYLNLFGSTAGGATIQTAVVPITSANFLALRTTPIALVAAPASGKCVIVDNVSVKMTATATTYASGGALEFRYTGTSGTKVTADVAAAVVTAGAGVSFTNVRGIEASLTGTVDAAVVITCASADFTTGTGTAVVTVQYHVV